MKITIKKKKKEREKGSKGNGRELEEKKGG